MHHLCALCVLLGLFPVVKGPSMCSICSMCSMRGGLQKDVSSGPALLVWCLQAQRVICHCRLISQNTTKHRGDVREFLAHLHS